MAAAEAGAPPNDETLSWRTKLVYGTGDHAINLSLTSMSFLFPTFLAMIAGLPVALAGLPQLIGRFVDAFTDPAMGRISDQTTWRAGRRRPYLLIGMLPFGIAFALLWWNLGDAQTNTKFVFYSAVYILYSVSMTVISVPYLSLIPEMTSSYDERTSMNAYRAAFAITGALATVVAFRPLALALGGDATGYQLAGIIAGAWLVLPWFFVYRVTFERPTPPPQSTPFLREMWTLFRHQAFVRLMGLFLLGRVAIDLATSMFLIYFTYWLARPGDFTITFAIFLLSVIAALPVWTQIGKRVEKRAVFLLGAASWIGSQAFMLAAQPDWPRWVIFLGAAIGGAGYAAADVIPWSMLGEVVDEDELRCGERREGLYFGVFTFLRKLAGSAVVAIAFAILGWVGFVTDDSIVPTETHTWTIRLLTAFVPAVFVFFAGLVALGYPLTRERHDEILSGLEARRAAGASPGAE